MTNPLTKDFLKILDKIRPSKNRWEVFSDWLIMASAALYCWKKDEKTENEYKEIAKEYKPEEMLQMNELLAITVKALEQREHDFLGEVFSEGELTNSRNGQFFTPYPVSLMMAKMNIEVMDLPTNKLLRINDPCSGAGGMLIAAIEVLKSKNFDYQNNAYFIAQDIDARCARMSFIQLTLLGAPAVIICGNTLTMETTWVKETLCYHTAGIDFRLRAEKMLRIMKKIETDDFSEPTEEKQITEIQIPRSEKLVQGELFDIAV